MVQAVCVLLAALTAARNRVHTFESDSERWASTVICPVPGPVHSAITHSAPYHRQQHTVSSSGSTFNYYHRPEQTRRACDDRIAPPRARKGKPSEGCTGHSGALRRSDRSTLARHDFCGRYVLSSDIARKLCRPVSPTATAASKADHHLRRLVTCLWPRRDRNQRRCYHSAANRCPTRYIYRSDPLPSTASARRHFQVSLHINEQAARAGFTNRLLVARSTTDHRGVFWVLGR